MTIQGIIVEGFEAIANQIRLGFYALRLGNKLILEILERIQREQLSQRADTAIIREDVERLLQILIPGPTVSAVIVLYNSDGSVKTGALKMNDSTPVDFKITVKDKAGNPSNIDPTKTVVSPSDTSLVVVTINPDGLSGTVTPLGPLGTFTLSGSVSDDPTDGSDGGTISIASTAPITITAGDTVLATIELVAVPNPPAAS